MPVIKRNADIIQSQAFEELGVDIGEEVLKELNSIRYEINNVLRQRTSKTHLVEEKF
jgi:hypothetical protein